MERSAIHVVCNLDASYVKYCVVMLTSLFENNRNACVHVHLIAPEFTAEMKDMFSAWVEQRYQQHVSFYEVGEDYLENCTIYGNSHISLATYYRIFIEDILPKNIDKVLYLDCDLVVVGSISDLWNIDITDYAVGCVEDMWSGKKDNYERLHYPSSFSYFNAGVLLVNLGYWRRMQFRKQAEQYLVTHVNELVFNDQDLLNALLYDKKLFLPFRYNVQDGFLRTKRRIRPAAIPELDKELHNLVVIHYTGGKKPWQYKSLNPYRNVYYYYLDKTKWKGERPVRPFSYKVKLAVDKLFYLCRLARPKYRKLPVRYTDLLR